MFSRFDNSQLSAHVVHAHTSLPPLQKAEMDRRKREEMLKISTVNPNAAKRVEKRAEQQEKDFIKAKLREVHGSIPRIYHLRRLPVNVIWPVGDG